MKTTKHARDRLQQRAIPVLIVEWLFSYGAREHSREKTVILFFDRKARKKLQRAVGSRVVNLLAPVLDAYIVIDAETRQIITAGHRFKRIKHAW